MYFKYLLPFMHNAMVSCIPKKLNLPCFSLKKQFKTDLLYSPCRSRTHGPSCFGLLEVRATTHASHSGQFTASQWSWLSALLTCFRLFPLPSILVFIGSFYLLFSAPTNQHWINFLLIFFKWLTAYGLDV